MDGLRAGKPGKTRCITVCDKVILQSQGRKCCVCEFHTLFAFWVRIPVPKIKYHFHLFICMHWVLAVAQGIFDLHCGVWLSFSCTSRTLHCDTWDLVPWPEMESRPPAFGSAESEPLDHQGSPCTQDVINVSQVRTRQRSKNKEASLDTFEMRNHCGSPNISTLPEIINSTVLNLLIAWLPQ